MARPAQAEEAIRRYIARTPNDLAGYKVLARIQFAKRRPDLAADTLAKVVESGQGDAEAYDLLGRAYAATGRSDESVKAFQKAESLAPNDVGLQTRLASARMGAGQAESAMDDLEHTLELAPTAPQVGEALFFAALATGDLNKAADAVEKVRSAQGDTPVVQNLEGLLKLAQLDVDGAAAKFRDVLKKNPDFVPAQINLSRVSAMQGKPAEAEQLLTALLDKNPVVRTGTFDAGDAVCTDQPNAAGDRTGGKGSRCPTSQHATDREPGRSVYPLGQAGGGACTDQQGPGRRQQCRTARREGDGASRARAEGPGARHLQADPEARSIGAWSAARPGSSVAADRRL